MLDIPTKPYPKQDLISVDDHIIEPADVWTARAPAKFKDRAPKVVVKSDGAEVWQYEGQERTHGGLSALAGREFEEYTVKAFAFKDMRPGCYDARERVKDMDLDGVRVQICFPEVPGINGESFLRLEDPAFRDWTISAYNDWLTDEFQPTAPGRLYGHGILPLLEPEKAVAELRRIVKRGIKSIVVCAWIDAMVPGARRLVDPCYDPVWSACEEMDVPVNMHIGGGRGVDPSVLTAGIPGLAEAFIHRAQLNNFETLGDIIWTGMLERHPRLKVISTEGGIGWLPYFLEWGDHVYERHRHWAKTGLPHPPSFYFHRQCYGAFLDDPAGVKLRHTIGVDNLLWESDYPHSDTTWPFSHRKVDEQMAGVPDDERRKITWENAARLYKLQ